MIQVRTLSLTPYVGWVCPWFSLVLQEVFLRHSSFPLSLKNITSKFQFYLERTDAFQRVVKNSVSKQITWIYKFTIYVEPIKPKRCKGYSKNLLCHSPLLSEGLWLYGRFYTCHLHHYILSRQVVGTPRSLLLANTTSTQHLKLNKVVVNVQNVPLKGIKNGFPQVRCTQSQIS